MLPVSSGLDKQALAQAKERSDRSDWAGAVEIYCQILEGSNNTDPLNRAQVTDLLAEASA